MKRYNGMNDAIFKNTFYIEKNKDLLKQLIESCLNMNIDEIELKLKELNSKQKYLSYEIFSYCEKFVKIQKALLTYNNKWL